METKLIYELLTNDNRIKNNDLIFYHDVNCIKYPDYLINTNLIETFIRENLYKKSILL